MVKNKYFRGKIYNLHTNSEASAIPTHVSTTDLRPSRKPLLKAPF